ncbi:MAG TPA: lysophospholipid acyltransferase family protein [Rubricoccaceae bacterium]
MTASPDPPSPRVFAHPVPPTWAGRAWFAWVALVTSVCCGLFSPGLVLHSAFRPTARTFVSWMRPWSRTVLQLCRIQTRLVVRAPLPDGPVVFVANHQNVVDVLATSARLPRPFVYVARHELRTWPIVGWVLEKTACVFIDRSSARRAVETLRAAGERIRGGDSVLLFPEGGRSYTHHTEPFMRGSFMLALEAGVPIVPVTLVGHTGVLDERHYAARPGETLIVLGEPVPTAGLTRADAGTLADRLRATIEAELSIYG